MDVDDVGVVEVGAQTTDELGRLGVDDMQGDCRSLDQPGDAGDATAASPDLREDSGADVGATAVA